jgi:hypothetical protein
VSESWSARKFAVQFDLDEPAAYTYTRAITETYLTAVSLKLQAEGQEPIAGFSLFGEKSGVLPAGHYTFSGVADFQPFSPYGGTDRFVTLWGGYEVVLTVAPEPATLPVLGGLMVFALRLRRG